MNPSLGGKTILITGASSGLGQETARLLSAAGAQLVLCDLNAEAGSTLAEELNSAGGRARFFELDVSKPGALKAIIATASGELGPIAAALNSAGVDHDLRRCGDIEDAVFDRVMDVNVRGLWFCMKAEIAHMREHGGGHIINIASVAGLRAAPMMSLYSASKFAVVGLTKSAAIEYARDNIRVNAICPAVIRTPMAERQLAASPELFGKILKFNPMRRLGEPHEVASLVVWLCGDDSTFMNGEAIAIDGGLSA